MNRILMTIPVLEYKILKEDTVMDVKITKEMTMGELLSIDRGVASFLWKQECIASDAQALSENHLQMLHMFTELIQIFLLRNWMQQLMQNLVSNIRFAEQQKIEQ